MANGLTTFKSQIPNKDKLVKTQVQNLQKQGWGEFGEQNSNSALSNVQQEFNNWNAFLRVPEPRDIKIEFPLTVKAEPEAAIATLQKQEQVQEDRIDYDIAEVLKAEQALNQPHEFSASGSLPFGSENQSEREFIETSTNELEELDNNIIASAEGAKLSQGLEPLIEDFHTREPQEFKQDLDLVRHHSDIDFPYFFGWLGGLLTKLFEPSISMFGKIIPPSKHWKDTKSAVIDDLVWKQIFGFGRKKELTKEEQAKQKVQAANKRAFFDALRSGAARVISPEKRRDLKSRIESLNKSLKRGNLSYEGDLDANGQIRESSLVEEELANSKKSEEQLLEEKKKKMMMAGKAKTKSGPGITMSADKSHNFNNAAKLAG